MSTVAFIGLGNMGLPMSKCLLQAGFAVQAYDINPQVLAQAETCGAQACPSATAACQQADAIICMLPNGQIVQDLLLGTEATGLIDLIAGFAESPILIDCSTIAASESRQIGLACQQKGIGFVDAPVSGGIRGAEQGTLTFMMGGATQAIEKASYYLQPMGKHLFHAGDAGAGQVAKMCNNMMLAIQMIGSCEALQLGQRHGLDAKVLSDILKVSSGNNWVIEKYNPMPGVQPQSPASLGYQGGFMSHLMLKDLNLACQGADETQSPIPLGQMAQQLYHRHCQQQDNGTMDFSSILAQLEPDQ